MSRFLSLFAVIFSFMVTGVYADPVDPYVRQNITLESGQTITARPVGDEYGCYWIDDSDNGCYIYDQGKKAYVKVQPLSLRKRSAQLRSDIAGTTRRHINRENVVGHRNVLVILVDFPDIPFGDTGINEYYQELFNQEGFSKNGMTGSVRDYFLDQSNGKLDLYFDVTGPVRMPQPHDYYGVDWSKDTKEMVKTACEMVNDDVDFSKYDWDDDGEVEQVVIVFSGVARNISGVPADMTTIWSHQGVIGGSFHLDGVRLYKYSCSSDRRMVYDYTDRTYKDRANGIGTICHEFSHCLGLPDMYDGNGKNYGTSVWDLMGGGNHNNNGCTPAGFTAYDKMALGWQQPVVLESDTTISQMKAMSDGGETFLIPNDAYDNEYYLLEYRRQSGWDASLPGSGMLVSHVDYDADIFERNILNSDTLDNTHERCGLVLADNDKSSNSRKGDVYPWNGNNSLSDSTTPAFSLFNSNIDESYKMRKVVDNISLKSNNLMSFSFRNLLLQSEALCLTSENNVFHRTSTDSVVEELTIRNRSYQKYEGNLKVTLRLHRNNNLVVIEERTVSNVSLEKKESKDFKIEFNHIISDTVYNVRIDFMDKGGNYVYLTDCDFDTDSSFDIKMVSGKARATSSSSLRIKAKIENNSINDYSFQNGISIPIYRENNGHYEYVTGQYFDLMDLKAMSSKEFVFDLVGLNLDSETEYTAFAYYLSSAKSRQWVQMPVFHFVFQLDKNSIATHIDHLKQGGLGTGVDGQLIYDLNGNLVGKYSGTTPFMPKGIYIVKSPEGTKKLVIK